MSAKLAQPLKQNFLSWQQNKDRKYIQLDPTLESITVIIYFLYTINEPRLKHKSMNSQRKIRNEISYLWIDSGNKETKKKSTTVGSGFVCVDSRSEDGKDSGLN